MEVFKQSSERVGRLEDGPPERSASVVVLVMAALPIFQEVAPADITSDPWEVLGGFGHRRAVVEAAPDAGILDRDHDVVQGRVRPYARMLLQYLQAAVTARRRVEAFAFRRG